MYSMFSTFLHHQEISADTPEEDPCLMPQIKLPSNEGTGARKVNTVCEEHEQAEGHQQYFTTTPFGDYNTWAVHQVWCGKDSLPL